MSIETAKPAYPIGSVDSALRLLVLVAERGELRAATASRELGVARSTAHRMLQMLQYHGFVIQDEASKRYLVGPALHNLGLRIIRNLDIRAIARPQIQALVDEVGETVHFFQYDPAGTLLCLESIESPRMLHVDGRIGMTLPAFDSAAGRAVLAQLSDEEVRALYPNQRLPQGPGRRLTKRSDLLREIEETRARGYATNHGDADMGMTATDPADLDAGITAVAAAIPDSHGRPAFAIAAAAPSSRVRDSDVPRLGQAVVACAERIAAETPW